ncbi:MAG: MerR family transcriptional regulator [bacterium]
MARVISTKNKMRMKRLMAETGVTKATVQFYVNEGLIPKPIKTHANMAYYDESHVNAIRLVKELQSKRFLPLSVIKRVMQGEKGGMSVDEIRTLLEIDGKLFTNLEENPTLEPLHVNDLPKMTGVSLEDIRMMEQLKMLTPARKGNQKLYGEDDIRIVECFAKFRRAGFTPDLGIDPSQMKLYWDFMEMLVAEELKIFASLTAGKVPAQKLPAMVEAAATISSNLMGLFHRKILIETTRRYTVEFRKKDTEADAGGERSTRRRQKSGKARFQAPAIKITRERSTRGSTRKEA